ncbi:MAG: PAS domain S-box protein, partial [Gammaproteobacteria bacterium]
MIGLATDISERKQAEAALRASEAKFRSIFDNAQVGLWRTRLSDGRLMECNDRLAHMFGYRDRAEAKAQYRAPRQYADAETRSRMLALVHAHGEITNFEARMLRKDGSVVWVRYSAKLNPEGDYLEGVATDITGEKQALESLRASEQELSKILDSMQDTYYRTDKQGRLVRVSLSGEGLLGYRRDELIGRSLVDLYVDPD